MTPANEQGPLLISVKEAAAMLNCARSTLYLLLAEGKIVARKSGGRTVFLRGDLLDYANSLPEYEPQGRRPKR